MTHGGARAGAGRKPKADALVIRAFAITQDQAAWLKVAAQVTRTSRSVVIRTVLDNVSFDQLSQWLKT